MIFYFFIFFVFSTPVLLAETANLDTQQNIKGISIPKNTSTIYSDGSSVPETLKSEGESMEITKETETLPSTDKKKTQNFHSIYDDIKQSPSTY